MIIYGWHQFLSNEFKIQQQKFDIGDLKLVEFACSPE
jgi:hypothetical protein